MPFCFCFPFVFAHADSELEKVQLEHFNFDFCTLYSCSALNKNKFTFSSLIWSRYIANYRPLTAAGSEKGPQTRYTFTSGVAL